MVAADAAQYLPFYTCYTTNLMTYQEIGVAPFLLRLRYHSLSDQVCYHVLYWRHSEGSSLRCSLCWAPSGCIPHIHCHFYRCFCSHLYSHFYRRTWILVFLLVSVIPWLDSFGSSCDPFKNEYISTRYCFCHGSFYSLFQMHFYLMFNFCLSFFLSSW